MYKINFNESSGVVSSRIMDIENNTWFLTQVDHKSALVLNSGVYSSLCINRVSKYILVIFFLDEERYIVATGDSNTTFHNIQKVKVTLEEVKVKTRNGTNFTEAHTCGLGLPDDENLYLYNISGCGHIVVKGVGDNIDGGLISLSSGKSVKLEGDNPQNNPVLFPVDVTLSVSNI